MATANGPLAEEPLYGVGFVLEAIDVALPHTIAPAAARRLLAGLQATASSTDAAAAAEAAAEAAAGGAMGGLHIAKAAKQACRAALLSHRYKRKGWEGGAHCTAPLQPGYRYSAKNEGKTQL